MESSTNVQYRHVQKDYNNSKTSITTNARTIAPNISLRPATLYDSRQISGVMVAGFLDNEVYGDYLHPYRKKHPEDYRRMFERLIRGAIMKPTKRVFISATTTNDTQLETRKGEIITGVAIWERLGPKGSSIIRAQESHLHRLHRLYIQAVDGFSSYIRPDRSVCRENREKFYSHAPNYMNQFWVGQREESWYLDTLVVHPDYQGTGVGRALVMETGVEWARRDGVSASVIASHVGNGFYDRLGFVDVGSATTGVLEGMQGGKIKFLEGHLRC